MSSTYILILSSLSKKTLSYPPCFVVVSWNRPIILLSYKHIILIRDKYAICHNIMLLLVVSLQQHYSGFVYPNHSSFILSSSTSLRCLEGITNLNLKHVNNLILSYFNYQSVKCFFCLMHLVFSMAGVHYEQIWCSRLCMKVRG